MNPVIVSFLVFSLDEKRYACESFYVQRIFRAIEITEIPNAEKNILGIINLHGQILPVIDLRQILGIKAKRNIELDDIIVVIVDKEFKTIAMVVNSVNYIETEKNRVVPVDESLSTQTDFLGGLLKDSEGPIYILNMDNIVGQLKI